MKIRLLLLTAFVGICFYSHYAQSQQPASEQPSAAELSKPALPEQTSPIQQPLPAQVQDQESLEKAIADLQRQILELKAQNLQLQASASGSLQPAVPAEVSPAPPSPPITIQPPFEQVIPQTFIPQQTYQPIVVERPIYQVPQYCPNSYNYGPAVGFYGSSYGGYGGLGISVGRFNLDIPFGNGYYGHGNYGNYGHGNSRGKKHKH